MIMSVKLLQYQQQSPKSKGRLEGALEECSRAKGASIPVCSDLKCLTSCASHVPAFPMPQNPQMSEMWIHARSHVI